MVEAEFVKMKKISPFVNSTVVPAKFPRKVTEQYLCLIGNVTTLQTALKLLSLVEKCRPIVLRPAGICRTREPLQCPAKADVLYKED